MVGVLQGGVEGVFGVSVGGFGEEFGRFLDCREEFVVAGLSYR